MTTGLGRGLGSLIPQKTNKQESGENLGVSFDGGKDSDRILHVNPNLIKANPMQPRSDFKESSLNELVSSIKEYGIIQPLVVTKVGSGYELIAGERRLRASKIAGLEEIPVIVRDAEEQEKLELALVENLQRQELNPVETAVAYRRLLDEFNLTQEELAAKVGKSRPSVTNTLRLLNLPDEIKEALIAGKIDEGHAKYLMGIDSENKQIMLFRKILRNNLTVADTDKEAKRMGGTKMARVKINYADKDKEFAVREFFGARAEIKRKGHGGQIIISFYNDEELEEIIRKVQ